MKKTSGKKERGPTNRLVAGVAALIPQSSLVDVDKPAMPRHEVPSEM